MVLLVFLTYLRSLNHPSMLLIVVGVWCLLNIRKKNKLKMNKSDQILCVLFYPLGKSFVRIVNYTDMAQWLLCLFFYIGICGPCNASANQRSQFIPLLSNPPNIQILDNRSVLSIVAHHRFALPFSILLRAFERYQCFQVPEAWTKSLLLLLFYFLR